jgi:hypothetical protein
MANRIAVPLLDGRWLSSIARCSMQLSLQVPRSPPHKFTTRRSDLASVADPRERPLVTLTNQKMLLRLIAICDGGEDKVAIAVAASPLISTPRLVI